LTPITTGGLVFLSELTETIYAAGYGWDAAQEARRIVMEAVPGVAEAILEQPLSTLQADPIIPDELGADILAQLSISPEAVFE
jgi:hypothetical protein